MTTDEQTGRTTTFALPGGESIDMVWIKPGVFIMGSPKDEPGRYRDEGPQHKVKISQGFWLSKFVITQRLWQDVMGTRPWAGVRRVRRGSNNPAVYITWNDVQAFIEKLNKAEGAKVYSFPTEAEWEYACRAGTRGPWSFGNDRRYSAAAHWTPRS